MALHGATLSGHPSRLVLFRAFALAVLSLTTSAWAAPITVVTTDFIADSLRTNFNGFEQADAGNIVGQNYATYAEGGIRVTQVNEKITEYIPSVATTFMTPGFDGSRSWYANGGDYGYTSITMEDGSDFGSVGFLRGTGWVTQELNAIVSFLYFELWNDGARVQTGTLGPDNYLARYVGFSGGEFDQIKIRDSLYATVNSFGNGTPFEMGGQGGGGPTYNALAIDSIEVRLLIPEPGTFAIVGVSLAALVASRRVRRPAVRSLAPSR